MLHVNMRHWMVIELIAKIPTLDYTSDVCLNSLTCENAKRSNQALAPGCSAEARAICAECRAIEVLYCRASTAELELLPLNFYPRTYGHTFTATAVHIHRCTATRLRLCLLSPPCNRIIDRVSLISLILVSVSSTMAFITQ